MIALKHILSLTVGSYGTRGGILMPLNNIESVCDIRFAFRFPFDPFIDGVTFICI